MRPLESDFISTVSHELRTPLSSIAGALGLVAAGATGRLNSETEKLLGIALANTKRLIALINDLLEIDKVQAGKLRMKIASHSLRDVAKSAIDEISPLGQAKGVKMMLNCESTGDSAHVDSQRLAQVFRNLLSNAIKFSPPGESVRINISTGADCHRVDFIDNGPGVPEEFRQRLYDKFSQADSAGKHGVGGTGLGLAISREIVHRLNGRLRFTPNPEGGAIFTVELPAA